MHTMARDVLAVIDTVFGSRASFHLIGHSMGSMIAQRLAILLTNKKLSTRIDSISLLSGHEGGWFWNNFPTPHLISAAVSLILSGFEPQSSAHVNLKLHYTDQYLDQIVVDPLTSDTTTRRSIYYRRYLAGMSADASRDENNSGFWGHLAAVRTHCLSNQDCTILRQAPFPKLVMYGNEDPVVMPRASRQLASRIDAEMVEVRGAHFIIDEAATRVNQILDMHFSRSSRWDHFVFANAATNSIPRVSWMPWMKENSTGGVGQVILANANSL